MKQKIYYLPIKTPDGIVELEINHIIINKDEDNMKVTISTTIQGKKHTYNSDTTEYALYLLAKNLPENWYVKSCLSCRFGNYCPVGNADNELFCVTEFEPKEPLDLWYITEDDSERKNRSRTLFECCEHYKEQSKDYYTYSDYYFMLNDKKTD